MSDPIEPSTPEPEKTDLRMHQTGVRHSVQLGNVRHGKREKRKRKRSKNNPLPWLTDSADQAARPISRISLVLLVVGSLIGIVTIGIVLKSQPNADQPAPLIVDTALDPASGPPVFTQLPIEIAEAFLASTDPQERLQWVRNPQDVATRMKSYPEETLSQPAKKLTELKASSVQGMVYARFLVKFANGSQRLLSVVATENGPKIDWDAYARYCSTSWESIMNGSAGPAEVRALIKRGDYYSFAYRDESIWQCYEIISPDIGKTLYAYVQRKSKRGKLLASTLPEGRTRVQEVLLTISSSDNGHTHGQFTIDRVHTLGWIRASQDIEDVWTPFLLDEKNSPLSSP